MTQGGGTGRMRMGEILHLVWINIMENKFKVVLTSLGIIVGSATIILVVAVGHGGEIDVQNQFKNLNAGSINVTVATQADLMDRMMGGFAGGGGPPGGSFGGGSFGAGGGVQRSGGSGGGTGAARSGSTAAFRMPGMVGGGTSGRAVTLSTTDVDDIASLVPDLSQVSILNSGTGAVDGGELEEETDYTVIGALPEYQGISNLELLQGDFISEEDEEDKSKVAVIGYSLAQDIFGSAYLAYVDGLTIE